MILAHIVIATSLCLFPFAAAISGISETRSLVTKSVIPRVTAAPSTKPVTAVNRETAINLSALLESLASEIPTTTASIKLQIDTTSMPDAVTSTSSAISSTFTPLPTTTTSLFNSNSASSGTATTSKTTAIILIVVFSGLGVIGLLFAIFLFDRYRKHQYPFQNLASSRAISPIDDEEIESWRRRGSYSTRGTGAMSQTSLSILTMTGRNGDLWPLPEIAKSSCHRQEMSSSALKSPFMTYANDLPTSPSSITQKSQAPNARMGLTTEIRAGDVAYIPSIPTPKRHSSSSRSKRLPSFSKTISGGVGSVTMTESGAVYNGYSKSRASSLSSMAWSDYRLDGNEKQKGSGRYSRPTTSKTERLESMWFGRSDKPG